MGVSPRKTRFFWLCFVFYCRTGGFYFCKLIQAGEANDESVSWEFNDDAI